MRSIALTLFMLAFFAGFLEAQPASSRSQPRQAPAAQSRMTNSDVIEMVTAGLSDQIVTAAIQDSPARAFDLTPKGLVALKKAGVSDAVILVMQGDRTPAPPASSPAAIAPVPPSPARQTQAPATLNIEEVPAVVRQEDGLYYLDASGVKRVEAKTPYQTRTGSTAVARLTFGIKRNRLNAMLPGLSAEVQVSQSPKFYLHLVESESVGEYYLVRFTVKEQQARRELEVGSAGLGKAQAGFEQKDIFLIDAKRLEKDIYLISPKSGLSAGEYSLLQVPQTVGAGQTGLTPRKIFDFGVR